MTKLEYVQEAERRWPKKGSCERCKCLDPDDCIDCDSEFQKIARMAFVKGCEWRDKINQLNNSTL